MISIFFRKALCLYLRPLGVVGRVTGEKNRTRPGSRRTTANLQIQDDCIIAMSHLEGFLPQTQWGTGGRAVPVVANVIYPVISPRFCK